MNARYAAAAACIHIIRTLPVYNSYLLLYYKRTNLFSRVSSQAKGIKKKQQPATAAAAVFNTHIEKFAYELRCFFPSSRSKHILFYYFQWMLFFSSFRYVRMFRFSHLSYPIVWNRNTYIYMRVCMHYANVFFLFFKFLYALMKSYTIIPNRFRIG